MGWRNGFECGGVGVEGAAGVPNSAKRCAKRARAAKRRVASFNHDIILNDQCFTKLAKILAKILVLAFANALHLQNFMSN